MSDNNQQKFNSVFAYWDGKDKRVVQSKVLQPHLRKPVANVRPNPNPNPIQNPNSNSNQNPIQNPVNTTTTTSTSTSNSTATQPTQVEISNPVNVEQTPSPTPTQTLPQTESVNVVAVAPKQTSGYDNYANNNDENKRSVDVSNGGVQDDIVVGESSDVSVSAASPSSANGYSNFIPAQSAPLTKSQYDNFGTVQGEQRVLTPDEEAEQIVKDAERDMELYNNKSASNYSIYGGSMYTISYGYGGTDPYSVDDDDSHEEEDRCDISEASLLQLESLCQEDGFYANNSPSADATPTPCETSNDYQLLPQPTNYYISARPTTGYSHPKFLASKSEFQASREANSDESLTSWNSEFQRILEMDDSLEKFERLSSLEHDFVYAAESYGRIIISEHLLPDELKTIKPVSVGGIAGGEKYIVQGILFKFAVESDTYGLYGSDENAMKTAAHELNGCTSFLNCGVNKLHVPLMSYIDYRGFRLMALSLLPITKKTLVYGSSDAGQTVYTSNDTFNLQFSKAAKVLNLKTHQVQDSSGELKKIQGPIDIEGHMGTDGRFYLLDFARLSPPEPPVHRGAYLYRLLRLELVRSFSKPLCSDAFSPMSTISVEDHNAEVREAYEHLTNTVIPKFAEVLNTKDIASLRKAEFSKQFHAEGINMRHLGQVRQYVSPGPARQYLLIEALVRCLKSLTRELLRREMKKTHLPSDYPYRRLMVNFLNLIFGDSKSSDMFWNQILLPKLEKKFKGILNLPVEFEVPVDPKSLAFQKEENAFALFQEKGSSRNILLKRYLASIGVVLSKVAKEEFKKSEHVTFVDPDIEEMRTQITRLNIIDFADGMSLYYKSMLLSKENSARNRLLAISKSRLEQSLHSMSTNYAAIFQLGNVIRLMGKLASIGSRNEEVYLLAESTYQSLEKLRIDQTLLYQSKVFRAKTMLARSSFTGDKKQCLLDCIALLNEAIGITTNKCEATYYIAKAKEKYFTNNLNDRKQEHYDEIIAHLEEVLHEEPNNAKASFRLGEYSAVYPKYTKKTQLEISGFYNHAIIEDPSLLNKIEPTIDDTVWIFYPMTRNSPKIFEMVKAQLSSLDVIRFPKGFEVLEVDYPLYEIKDNVNFIMEEANEESISNLLRIMKFKPSKLSLMRTEFSVQSKVFTDLSYMSALSSINLSHCKGLEDYVIEIIATTSLTKLKIHHTEGLTDTSIKFLADKAPNLEVFDAGSCPGFTGEKYTDLVTGCPNIRKLALPKKAGNVVATFCLQSLNKLTTLDLFECEDIPQSFYNTAFTLSASIIKIRSENGFPYFHLQPQIFVHMLTRNLSNEAVSTLSGEKTSLMRTSQEVNHYFSNRVINVFFNTTHPLVKFRDNVTTSRGNIWMKVYQVTITDKPIMKFAIHRLNRSSNLWEVETHLPMPGMGFGPSNQINIHLYGLAYRVHYGTLPIHGGVGYAFTASNEMGAKILTSSNQRSLNMSYQYELFQKVPSNLMALFLTFSQMSK